MLTTTIVSVLCASCGNSGISSDPDATFSQQNGETVDQIITSDSIVGPGHSGFSVSEAQPVLLAAAEPDINAPGQPVSTALQQLGSVVSAPEPVAEQISATETVAEPSTPEQVLGEAQVVPDVSDTPDESDTPVVSEPIVSDKTDELSPEAKIEMAALEAELAELAEASEEAQTSEESEASEAEASEDVPAETTAEINESDSSGDATVSKSVSYDSIEANGLGNGAYPTDDHYLAEFLYQNPDVCFWDQDSKNRTITSLPTPVPPEDSVYMPSPTGGNDTKMIAAFLKKNAGKSVVGTGTYKVATLDIVEPVDIFNMSMVPASGAKQMVRVLSADVRIFNSPIDGQNMASLAVGFNVEDGSHRFVLVNSDVKNIHHKKSADASAVFVRGANNTYIACNRCENILNSTSDKSKTARANCAWFNGRNKHTLSGGVIANNYASNHQSDGARNDAEFFTVQSYKGVDEANPIRIFGNRTYNAGKRFTKNQEGDTLILSNYIEWNTKTGPLGRRTLIAPFVVHFDDNVIIRNNRVSVSAEGHFGAIFRTNSASGNRIQNNLHFDNNDIEIIDNRDQSTNSGPVLISAMATQHDLNSVGYEATNSSANNNNVYGSGSLRNYYSFRNGYAKTGGGFEHINNTISVPFYRSEYQ